MIFGICNGDSTAKHSFQFSRILIMIMMLMAMMMVTTFLKYIYIDFEAEKLNTDNAWVNLVGTLSVYPTAMTLYQCGPHAQFDNIAFGTTCLPLYHHHPKVWNISVSRQFNFEKLTNHYWRWNQVHRSSDEACRRIILVFDQFQPSAKFDQFQSSSAKGRTSWDSSVIAQIEILIEILKWEGRQKLHRVQILKNTKEQKVVYCATNFHTLLKLIRPKYSLELQQVFLGIPTNSWNRPWIPGEQFVSPINQFNQ